MKNLKEKDITGYSAKNMETIAVLSAACIVAFLLFDLKIFLFLSLALLAIGIISKNLTARISALWLGFSHVIGNFNSKIILALVFYIFLTPLAMLFRAFSKNPLLLKKDSKVESYYNDRNYAFKKDDFEKIW
ncbi:MAG: SxtJ family membrane protein [Thermodesulfovibrionales bacterium]|nr:SxtJ family membrane protein [Thermodesulfovibrionales bacterium]